MAGKVIDFPDQPASQNKRTRRRRVDYNQPGVSFPELDIEGVDWSAETVGPLTID